MAQLVKTVQSVAIASVKTVMGVAIASCKTIQGVDNTGGGPTLVASDDFDYTDQTDLDLAANWVRESGTINVNKPSGNIGSVFSGETAVGLYRHTASFNTDQRCEMTIDAAGTGGNFDWIGPAVRVQTGAATGYGVVFSSTDLYLISVDAGTQATIISDTEMSLAAGNRIAIEASGSSTDTRLKVQVDTGGGWVDKWTNQNPAVDIDGGACGVCSWALSGSVNRAKTFRGYDL